jgi:hypothetical protein
LPWYEPPGGAQWDVPFGGIAAGTTATVRIWNLPAPATCSMRADFPDGSTTNLGTVTATYVGPSPGSPAAYEARWALSVPAGMTLGEGRLTVLCSYLGVTRVDSWFGFRVT